jgi:hypothetical protein
MALEEPGYNNNYTAKPAGHIEVHSRTMLKQIMYNKWKRSHIFVYSHRFSQMLEFKANRVRVSLRVCVIAVMSGIFLITDFNPK